MGSLLIGSTVTVKPLTHKGRNRINRGGTKWTVEAFISEWGHLLKSVEKGNREMFWDGDNSVRIIDEAA